MSLTWRAKPRHSYAFWHAEVGNLLQDNVTRMQNNWTNHFQPVKAMNMTNTQAFGGAVEALCEHIG
jgi:hypothetical protein